MEDMADGNVTAPGKRGRSPILRKVSQALQNRFCEFVYSGCCQTDVQAN